MHSRSKLGKTVNPPRDSGSNGLKFTKRKTQRVPTEEAGTQFQLRNSPETPKWTANARIPELK